MNNKIKIIDGGNICSPSGFQASGISAGLKASGTMDMALIISDQPAIAAAAFTTSKTKAAPVLFCQTQLASHKKFKAIIINSGIANACTGETGLRNTQITAETLALELGISTDEVFVSSTGRIGTQLPMDKISEGIKSAVAALSPENGSNAAKAIMTTDTREKEIAVEVIISGTKVKIAGICKGAGMIAPEMKVPHATMLAYITTDALVDQKLILSALAETNEHSFNKISVDGDMSTNDTVIMLANGAAGNPAILPNTAEADLFQQALLQVMTELAKDIVLDGEGMTKFVTVQVKNAANQKDAKLATHAISNSLLCKTAWFGCDPNWGRVIAAVGYSGAEFTEEKVSLHYNGIPVVIDGVDAGTPESDLVTILKNSHFTITVNLNAGSAEHEMWTNDISYEYVKINADYHT